MRTHLHHDMCAERCAETAEMNQNMEYSAEFAYGPIIPSTSSMMSAGEFFYYKLPKISKKFQIIQKEFILREKNLKRLPFTQIDASPT